MLFEQPIFPKIWKDAVIRALLLVVAADLLVTGYIVEIPVLGVVILAIATLAPVLSGWLFTKTEEKNKRILAFATTSFLLGLFFSFCLMLLSIVFSIRLFPVDYMSNASPALLFVIMPYVLLGTSLLRIPVFAFRIIKNIVRNKEKARNISAS